MPKIKDRPVPQGVDPHRGENKHRVEVGQTPDRVTKKKPGGHISGYCNDEAAMRDFDPSMAGAIAASPDAIHDRCSGGCTMESGKFSPCVCPGHDGEAKCHLCWHVFASPDSGDYDPERRRCAGADECAARIAARSARLIAASPLHQQIREIRETSAERHRAAREENLAKMQQANQAPRPEAADVAGGSGPVAPPGRGHSTPRKLVQLCHDGCGGMTKGGRFLPGHDMKLKGLLFDAARQPDPSEERSCATDEIVARGWNTSGCNPDLLEQAAQMDPDEVVRDQVRIRYDDDTIEVA